MDGLCERWLLHDLGGTYAPHNMTLGWIQLKFSYFQTPSLLNCFLQAPILLRQLKRSTVSIPGGFYSWHRLTNSRFESVKNGTLRSSIWAQDQSRVAGKWFCLVFVNEVMLLKAMKKPSRITRKETRVIEEIRIALLCHFIVLPAEYQVLRHYLHTLDTQITSRASHHLKHLHSRVSLQI